MRGKKKANGASQPCVSYSVLHQSLRKGFGPCQTQSSDYDSSADKTLDVDLRREDI